MTTPSRRWRRSAPRPGCRRSASLVPRRSPPDAVRGRRRLRWRGWIRRRRTPARRAFRSCWCWTSTSSATGSCRASIASEPGARRVSCRSSIAAPAAGTRSSPRPAQLRAARGASTPEEIVRRKRDWPPLPSPEEAAAVKEKLGGPAAHPTPARPGGGSGGHPHLQGRAPATWPAAEHPPLHSVLQARPAAGLGESPQGDHRQDVHRVCAPRRASSGAADRPQAAAAHRGAVAAASRADAGAGTGRARSSRGLHPRRRGQPDATAGVCAVSVGSARAAAGHGHVLGLRRVAWPGRDRQAAAGDAVAVPPAARRGRGAG